MRQSPNSRLLAALALAGLITLTSGCLYRVDIKQGNLLDPAQVLQLQEGMTRSQVRFLLGTPMLPHGFNNDRWNYYYYEKLNNVKQPLTRRVTVWFKDDKVERFDRPADTESAAAAMAAANADAAAEAAALNAPSTTPAATAAPAAPPASPPAAR